MVGRRLRASRPLNPRPYAVARMRLFFEKGKAFYIEFTIRLFFFLIARKASVFVANDLDTLLPNFLAAKFWRARLVYDSHEYFTEVPELVHRPATRKMWLGLERLLFPHLKYIVTVNESIADVYRALYKKTVAVVHNVPFRWDENRRTRGYVSGETPVVLYQGAVNKGRGVDMMVRAAALLPETRWLIIGGGDDWPQINALVDELSLRERVVLPGALPFEELPVFTSQAHIGLSIEEDAGLNYRYATPNKLFDYFQAGLPVIISDLPAMRAIVETFASGVVLTERTPEALAQTISALIADATHYARCRGGALRAAETLHWENEKERLRPLYF